MPHQKAVAGDGLTILERAVIEHNMVAASKIYDNIAFEQLGVLLEIGAEKAERVAARMVSEARLAGAINQVDGFLHFERETDVLRDWDGRITSVSLAVNPSLSPITITRPLLSGRASASGASEYSRCNQSPRLHSPSSCSTTARAPPALRCASTDSALAFAWTTMPSPGSDGDASAFCKTIAMDRSFGCSRDGSCAELTSMTRLCGANTSHIVTFLRFP